MFGDGLQWINIGVNISMIFGFPWWDVGPYHIHPMFSPWFLWIQAILGLLGGRMSATHQPQRSAMMHQTALVTSSTCILNLDLLRCSAGASEFGDGDFWHPKRSLPTKNQGQAWNEPENPPCVQNYQWTLDAATDLWRSHRSARLR
jgi:hypothetical protein